jgi:glutathione peroxidase
MKIMTRRESKMKMRLGLFLFALWSLDASAEGACPAVLDYTVKPLSGGSAVSLCSNYQGKVLLVVNTASMCGYTTQLKGLEALYQRYRGEGFFVLGFPSNSFQQEHEDPLQTQKVLKEYGVSFPMYETSSVLGLGAQPFFKALTKASGIAPSWNFQKYLIDRAGRVIKSYPANVSPEDLFLKVDLEAALKAQP